jgi:UDP-N-acetylglucosamine:LPS N-acetylglucosamine transferase
MAGAAKRVLAISSSGGHWVQLLRCAPAWDGCEVHYATSSPDFRARVAQIAAARGQPVPGYHLFTDANRWQKLRLVRQLLDVAAILLKVRPHAIITTGASAGYFAIRLGKLMGAKTCWLDSIANAQELSLSGAQAGPHADLFLTQWPDLAKPGGPDYRGAVL